MHPQVSGSKRWSGSVGCAGPFLPLASEDSVGEIKAPSLTLSQLRVLLRVVLPMREFNADMTIELVRWIRNRNHRAYLSHGRKKLMNINNVFHISL